MTSRNSKEWQSAFGAAVKKKFPKSMTPEDRLLAVYRQMGDLSGAMAFEAGRLKAVGHGYDNVPHRLACVFAELFILANEMGEQNLDVRLAEVLAWYEAP